MAIQKTPDGLLFTDDEGPYFTEEEALGASYLACQIADAWVGIAGHEAFRQKMPRLAGLLDRIDISTRNSSGRMLRDGARMKGRF